MNIFRSKNILLLQLTMKYEKYSQISTYSVLYNIHNTKSYNLQVHGNYLYFRCKQVSIR